MVATDDAGPFIRYQQEVAVHGLQETTAVQLRRHNSRHFTYNINRTIKNLN